ncbi:MAG TPA: YtxH domain-containing protein [Anaerolineales bacterium]|nr:YtxH domain-containing protein [Anaerolineales bacterium]
MAARTEELTYTTQMDQKKMVLKALLVGSLVGAGTMLFLAPQSGRKLRANIAHKTHELREHTTEAVKDKIAQVKSRGHQIKEDVREKAEDLQQQGVDGLAEQLERIVAAAEAGMKALKGSRR